MKNIIISDINGNDDSIIPYALNFAKFIDEKVQLIHSVDPRTHQGIAGAYADSQSFEVGEKLTHEKIVEREKYKAQIKLDILLSKEASKLNFPLRVGTIVEENSIYNLLMDEIGNDQSSFLTSSSSFNRTAFHNMTEFLKITNQLNAVSFIVPPGQKALTPQKLIVFNNFNSGNNERIFKMLESIKQIDLSITTVDVSEQNKYNDKLVKSEAWKQIANKHIDLSKPLDTYILVGEQFMDTVLKYIRRNNFDLVAIPRNIKELTGISKYPKYNLEEMINEIALPVLLY